jgi:hypothetical protein
MQDECDRKRLLVRYDSGIFLEGVSNTTRTSVRIADLSAKVELRTS